MPNDWRQEARSRVAEKKEGATFKVVAGDNYIRILPNKKGPQFPPYAEFSVHDKVGPDQAQVACGKKLKGNDWVGKCWMCDTLMPQLMTSTSPNKQKLATIINRREKFMVQACKLEPQTRKFSSPKPWWVSTGSGIPGKQSRSLATTIFSLITQGRVSFDDPVKGHAFILPRTGMGQFDTVYGTIDRDDEPTPVPANVLNAMKNFEELLPVYSEEAQKKAFYGKPDEPAGGDYAEEAAHAVSDADETPLDEQLAEEEYPADDAAAAEVEVEQDPGTTEYEDPGGEPQDFEQEQEPPQAAEGEDDWGDDSDGGIQEGEPLPDPEPAPPPPPRRAAPPRAAAPPAGRTPAPPAAPRRAAPPATTPAVRQAPPATRPAAQAPRQTAPGPQRVPPAAPRTNPATQPVRTGPPAGSARPGGSRR